MGSKRFDLIAVASPAPESLGWPLLSGGTGQVDCSLSFCSRLPFSSGTPFCLPSFFASSSSAPLFLIPGPSLGTALAAEVFGAGTFAAGAFVAATFLRVDVVGLVVAVLLGAVPRGFLAPDSCWFVASLLSLVSRTAAAGRVAAVLGAVVSTVFLVRVLVALDVVPVLAVAVGRLVAALEVALVAADAGAAEGLGAVLVTEGRAGAAVFFSATAVALFVATGAVGFALSVEIGAGFALGARGAFVAAGLVDGTSGFRGAASVVVPAVAALANDGCNLLGTVLSFLPAVDVAVLGLALFDAAIDTVALGLALFDAANGLAADDGLLVGGCVVPVLGVPANDLRFAAARVLGFDDISLFFDDTSSCFGATSTCFSAASVIFGAASACSVGFLADSAGLTKRQPPSFSESESSVTPSASGMFSGILPKSTGAEGSSETGFTLLLSVRLL